MWLTVLLLEDSSVSQAVSQVSPALSTGPPRRLRPRCLQLRTAAAAAAQHTAGVEHARVLSHGAGQSHLGQRAPRPQEELQHTRRASAGALSLV